MSSPLINTNKELIPSESRKLVNENLCNHCSGNGYTKSSPDCYRTCLSCFGKGILNQIT